MTTSAITKQPVVTKPQLVKPAASGKAVIALMPPDKEGGPPVNCIVRYTASGALRAVSVPMRMDPSKGETFGLSAKVGDDWTTVHSLTALAYDKLNTVAGVTFFTLPERLIDNDGKERPNPWIEQDKHGAIHFVRVAQVGFGRSATGNLVAHALSVTFDLRTYLAQDLWSKWQGKKGYDGGRDKTRAKAAVASKEWGVLTPQSQEKAPNETHTLPFHIPAGVILWCDYTHPEVQNIIGEHINRQKFAERNAITICRRNILKKIFGVSRLDKTMTVQVTGFIQEDRDLVAMGRAVAAAQAGDIVIDGEQIKIEKEDMGVVSEQEVDESLAGEDDEDADRSDGPVLDEEPGTVAPSAPPPVTEDPAKAAARAKLRKLIDALGDAAWVVLGNAGIGDMAEIGRLGNVEYMNELIASLEKEQLAQTQAKAASKTSTASKPKDKLFEEPKKPQGPI